jgi:hypothetical protein
MAEQGDVMTPQHQPPATEAFEDVYVSIRGACERFGMSRSGVYELIRQHRVKKYRRAFDSRTYVKIADVEAVRAKMPSQRRELIQGR